MIRALAVTASIAATALGVVAPRIALATPARDACTGFLRADPVLGARQVIEAPGVWCLDANLVADDPDYDFTLIRIAAADVTIDCRGYRLEYAGSGGTAVGIATQDGAERATVRHCELRYFSNSIEVSGTEPGFLVEDNVIVGIRPGFVRPAAGILGIGHGTIRRNRISNAVDVGIHAYGSVDVIDNAIDGVSDNGFDPAQGIRIEGPDHAQVTGNSIRRLYHQAGPSCCGSPLGIVVRRNSADDRAVIRDNVLAGDGFSDSVAFSCESYNLGFLKDNVVTGFATLNYGGCSDDGDNDHTP